MGKKRKVDAGKGSSAGKRKRIVDLNNSGFYLYFYNLAFRGLRITLFRKKITFLLLCNQKEFILKHFRI